MKSIYNEIGETRLQEDGVNAYFPRKLASPDARLEISYDSELVSLLSEAERALGELNGVTQLLPHPDLFVAFYTKKEALLSSQIEGTQCSMDEVVQADEKAHEANPLEEIFNYMKAMDIGLDKNTGNDLTVELIKEIHKILLSGVRGQQKQPGEFKTIQNWVGPAGSNIKEATFIPMPPEFVVDYMDDLVRFYNQSDNIPPLIKAAIIHSYFETIHPFADGNGRLGRLLITFYLCKFKILDKPLLYLSLFFKEHKPTYYELLMKVRFEGKWDDWLKFFLRGIRNTSLEAISTAKELIELKERHLEIINREANKLSYAHKIYNILCYAPIIPLSRIATIHNIAYPTVKRTIKVLSDLNIVKIDESTSGAIVRLYEYMEILRRGTT